MPRRQAISDAHKVAAEQAVAALERTVKFLVTDFTTEYLAGKVRNEEYYVPEYQRELRWDERQQSRFIESLLMGLPIPFVFLWQAPDGRLEIVDGSQRLRTIVRFLDGELPLRDLELLPESNGFRFLDFERSRQRKFENQAMRGIVLDNSVSDETRTEMFNRINTGGTKLNDAEIRRGSLPGPFTDLVIESAQHQQFIEMTPLSGKLVKEREREELVIRFFTYLETLRVGGNGLDLPGWKDRPREFIWKFVKGANEAAADDPAYITRLRDEFARMVAYVAQAFPNGFRKSATGTQIPRVRFEAIAVGAGLALRNKPELAAQPVEPVQWADDQTFADVTTSDAANVRSKLLGRISYVYDRLLR
jgi:hypothetical protein